MENTLPPHVIIMPSPGMGHLIPIIEFAKRFILAHGFSATLIIPTETKSPFQALKLVLDCLPSAINTILLPPVDLSDLPNDVVTQIVATVNRSLPSFSDSIRTITSTHRVVSLVVDVFCTNAIHIGTTGNPFHINGYIFRASSALFLSLVYHSSKLDQVNSCDFRDVSDPIQIPGCVSIRGKTENYANFLEWWKELNLGRGIFALNGKQWDNPPVYVIGPLIRTAWLDNQPPGSVPFVSFGSGGTLSSEQLTELALGLEMSEQKFLWFLRRPEKAAGASYLRIQDVEDPSKVLPKGFLDRTRKSGLVISKWAPQIEILNHPSTGGFLTHCGWNSILESIVHGVPLIAWPLFAEQMMTSVLLTDDVKVALRPKPMKGGVIGHDEICKLLKGLMEGEEGKRLRSKVRELKCVATSTLAEGGSSFKTLADAVNAWKSY
ncbi:hypothetical protein MKW98_014248 [Papaver atlanticum]|uniref:Glycosyltransferase n=1 Tax=Papaver atlanticum TaxID=357466 RepID=A0AAD4T8Q1_9MAGN|nr:hypothetical protein MKW98_014248 [Papaver atlanticum]